MQDYKSAAVTICAITVNIQTHRQHSDQLIRTDQPAELQTAVIIIIIIITPLLKLTYKPAET